MARSRKIESPLPHPPQADAPISALPGEVEDDEDESGEGLAEGWARAEPVAAEERCLKVSSASHGQRLDAFLAAAIPSYSRNHLKSLIEEGCVHVGDVPMLSPSRKVSAGQAMRVTLKPTAQSQSFVAEAMHLDIVFEDDHLMVVNKPAGLVVHPAAGNWTGTLMNGLLAHHAGAVNLPRAGIVHRLDKDTSGLMVVGKTLAAVTALSRAIAARDVSRQYLALVHAEVPESFSVNTPIGRDPATRVRMAVVASGKPARTDVRRLLCAEWLPPASGPGVSQRSQAWVLCGVLCTLHTGRTHQIRVHLSSVKHPLVSDAVYGGKPALGMTRQALHATRLAFAHPITGEALKFEAALPADMAQAWSSLEQGVVPS